MKIERASFLDPTGDALYEAPLLSNAAQIWTQEAFNFVTFRIPRLGVSKQTFKVPGLKRADFNRRAAKEDIQKTPGSIRPTYGFTTTSMDLRIQPLSLQARIDEQDYSNAAGEWIALEEDTARFVAAKLALEQEIQFKENIVDNADIDTVDLGTWTSDNTNPIKEVEDAIADMVKYGVARFEIYAGASATRAARGNMHVQEALYGDGPTGGAAGGTEPELARVFGVAAWNTSTVGFNDSDENTTAANDETASLVIDNEVVIAAVPGTTLTRTSPSAFGRFIWTDLSGAGEDGIRIRQIPDPMDPGSTFVIGDVAPEIAVINKELAMRDTNVVS